MNRITRKMLEKAATKNNWQLSYYQEGSDMYVSFQVGRYKNQPSVTHHFRIHNDQFLIFKRTYSSKNKRNIKTIDQRDRIENLILKSSRSTGNINKSLLFKLANKLISEGLSRKVAFQRARSIVQDPGSINVSDSEKMILSQYGVDLQELKTHSRKIPKYKLKEAIKEAIHNKNVIKIYYKGESEKVVGPRIVEPFVYGIWGRKGKTKRGRTSHILRAYQIKGPSEFTRKPENPIPGWRAFRIDRITYMEILPQTFKKARPDYYWPGDTNLQVITQAKI